MLNDLLFTFLFFKELDLEKSGSFIQEYVSDPYLVDGRKFDIGIYTVITSLDPLVVYVLNSEWLIRSVAVFLI